MQIYKIGKLAEYSSAHFMLKVLIVREKPNQGLGL